MKTIIAFIEPLGLAWLCFTALLVRLLSRGRRREAVLFGVPWLLLTLVFCTPLPSMLLASMERPWVGADIDGLAVADAVVSLGGTGEPSRREPVGFHLTRGADRLMTSVELMRRGKSNTLVLGGGGYYRREAKWGSEADAAKRWIDSWGVSKSPAISLGVCADTHDEAAKTAVLAKEHGWKSIILVTSASHMSRAEATFKKAGFSVACAPCNLLSSEFRDSEAGWFHVPHAAGAELFGVWFHEVLGWLAYRWRGWV